MVGMSAIAVQPRIAQVVGVRQAPRSVVRDGAAAPVRVADPVGRERAAVRPAAGAAADGGRLHLTRRGRVVLLLLAAAIVVGGVMGGQAVADGPPRATEVTTHSVQAGETLWQIAAGVAAPGEDVRDVVLRLQELNGLADGSLVAGQVVLLPADS